MATEVPRPLRAVDETIDAVRTTYEYFHTPEHIMGIQIAGERTR